MTDYERAAGVAGHPTWRTDLRYQHLIALARPLKDQVILDVGTGDGRLAWKYGAHADARKFIGVDISFDLLAVFRQRMPNAMAVVCDLNDGLPFRRESVDRVLCTEAFEHFAAPDLVLKEFARVVTPGGRIVIQSPSAMQLRNLNPFHVLQCLVGRFLPSLLQPVVVHENTWVTAFTYHWDFTIQQLRGFCEPLGLRIRRTVCAMYRFNPDGSWVHRIGHAMTKQFPLKHLGWDRTVLIERPMSRKERQ
jgi:ubiquinone/menaquinone biosynthesis C-methylase UbiE